MQKLVSLVLVVCAMLALSACGGGNADNHGHDHGGGDVHGKEHKLGDEDLGDGYSAMASLMGDMEGKEAIFEVTVMKDKKALKGADVVGWITSNNGDKTDRGTAEWMDAESLYDLHVALKAEPAEGSVLNILVLHEGKERTATFKLPHHDH